MTIGRDNENDIVIDSLTVSRCHAVLLRDATGVRLIDLESTNGTLVNGVPARPDEPVRLDNGNIIQIGQVRARYCAAPPDGGDLHTPREPAHTVQRERLARPTIRRRLAAIWLTTAQELCMSWAIGESPARS